MADISDKDLAGTRAALAPTLDATASILPWVGKTQPLRFSPELNQRWQAACGELAETWATWQPTAPETLRPAIFNLLKVALEAGDADCLQLCDALASVADRMEVGELTPRLRAALSASIEVLQEEGGLENPQLAQRSRHCVQRIDTAIRPSHKPGERSDVLDALFVEDTEDRLARMRDALAALPIDVYALQLECQELIQHAEQIEMWGIYHLARQLEGFVLQLSDLSERVQDDATREIDRQMALIETSLRAVDR